MPACLGECVEDLRHRIVPNSRQDFAVAALASVGILLLVPRLVSFWNITISLVLWPWQFDFDEGHNLNATVLLAQGTNIYQPNGPGGFISAPYTPLFYMINAPFTWLLGPAFGPGRLVSALATVAIAILLAAIIHTLTGRWSLGLLAGTLWLSFSPVIVWAGFYKQDMPAMALELAGLAWVLHYADSKRRYWAVLFFALAFFTKQSAVAGAAAASLWLLLRDWRSGLRFVGLMAAAIFVPYFALDGLLDGGLSEHVIGYQSKPWRIEYSWHLLSRLWSEDWPIIIAAAGVLGCTLVLPFISRGRSDSPMTPAVRLRGMGNPLGLITLYTIAAIGWTCIITGIKGGNYNLLLDGLPPIALLVPLGAGWLLSGLPNFRGQLRVWTAGGVLLLATLFLVQVALFNDPHDWYHGGWPSEQQDQSMQGLSNLVAHTPGDIYSEDDYLVLHNGRPVIYDDPSTFPLLAQTGRWDDSGFDQSLRDRRLGLIILWPGSGRLTASESQVFDENYKLAYADILNTYVPKPVPDLPQYPVTCHLALGTDEVRLNGYSLAPGVAERGIQPETFYRWLLIGRQRHL